MRCVAQSFFGTVGSEMDSWSGFLTGLNNSSISDSFTSNGRLLTNKVCLSRVVGNWNNKRQKLFMYKYNLNSSVPGTAPQWKPNETRLRTMGLHSLWNMIRLRAMHVEQRWSVPEDVGLNPIGVREFFSFSVWGHFLSKTIAQKVLSFQRYLQSASTYYI